MDFHRLLAGYAANMNDRVAANVAWVWKINRDKASGKYAEFEGRGDDRDPAFKMVM